MLLKWCVCVNVGGGGGGRRCLKLLSKYKIENVQFSQQSQGKALPYADSSVIQPLHHGSNSPNTSTEDPAAPVKASPRKRIGMYSHVLNAGFSERPEGLFIDGLFFEFVQRFQAIDDFSKHRVLHVQMGLFGIRDEKLGAIRVGAIVCHRNHSSDVVFEMLAVLVFKFTAPYTRSSFACACWIASLNHETFNVPMERAATVEAAGTQSKKVLARFRCALAEELDFDVPQVGVKRDGHFK